MKKQEHTTSSNQNIMQMKAEAEEEEEEEEEGEEEEEEEEGSTLNMFNGSVCRGPVFLLKQKRREKK